MRSAWIPAPPLQSEPAIVRQFFIVSLLCKKDFSGDRRSPEILLSRLPYDGIDQQVQRVRRKSLSTPQSTPSILYYITYFRSCQYAVKAEIITCADFRLTISQNPAIIVMLHAPVVKLADTMDLGSISARNAGSSPVRRTSLTKTPLLCKGVFV